jgi:THO complex subunit 2
VRHLGNFDLDPDRTLDIILDTFSDEVVHHHQFFIDFLSVSPWAPKRAKTTNGGNMETDESTDKKGKAREVLMDIGLEAKEGSSLIAQILGFKFAYYQVRLLSTLSNYFLLTGTTRIET